MDPFLVEVLNFLIKNHNARDKAVRYRCCQLINKLLGRLGDDDTIGRVDLYKDMQVQTCSTLINLTSCHKVVYLKFDSMYLS